MTGNVTYSTRRNIVARERTFALGSEALEWRDEWSAGSVAYADIVEVCFRRVRLLDPLAPTLTRQLRCVIRPSHGSKIVLVSTHYVGIRRTEDRRTAYIRFIRALVAKIRTDNPRAVFVFRPHWSMKLSVPAGKMAVLLLRVVRRMNRDRVADICGWFMRRIGPFLAQQRTGRENLRVAFPEKSPAEIEQILRGVWDNVGRLAAEFAHLDRLWDLDHARAPPGTMVLSPDSETRLLKMRDDGKPALLFSAHLANWELPALAATAYGLESAALYRRPNVQPIADEISRIRLRTMGKLIAAGPSAPLQIVRCLKRGAHVGMLVDQHLDRGVEVVFFGRRCKANPLLARLARQFDCPIHGTRVVRLPDHRFYLELTPAIDAPRDDHNRIDVQATMQMITLIIEGWIREHPDQWLWLHRRWR